MPKMERGGVWPCKENPGGCPCRCHAVVRGMARRPRKRRTAWLPAHDALIRERLLAGDPPAEIAVLLTERFGVRRTEGALRRHISAADILLHDGFYSRDQLYRGLGISERRMRQFEAQAAFGPPYPWRKWKRYGEEAVEAFVREHAGTLIDPRGVTLPKLRALAETSAIVNKRREAS